MQQPITLNFRSPCGSCELAFEDNGKVAYAYLKTSNEIVGDVWLYNRCPSPIAPEWSDRSKIPFANSAEYIEEQGRLLRPVQREDVLVNWETDDHGPVAYIYIFEDLYGVVGINDKPGYARFAKKDNRLAKVMEIE